VILQCSAWAALRRGLDRRDEIGHVDIERLAERPSVAIHRKPLPVIFGAASWESA
jgi:hypothetical protein